MSPWLHRVVLVGLLLAAYLFAWTPARTAWTAQSAKVLKHVTDATDAEATVTARPGTHVLRIERSADTSVGYTAPAGVKFLLPGLFLIVIAPRRPRLGVFFAGHLALGACTLALLAAGIADLPGTFGAAGFVQTYVVDAYSLAVPVFLFARSRNANR